MSQAPIDSLELIVPNSPAEISKAIHDFQVYCKEKNYSLALVYKLRLAMEELLVNTISYSYKDKQEHNIHIKIESTSDQVTIVFIDDGIEFNPLSVPPPKDIPIEDRIPGGVGVYLVKTMMDTFVYQRLNGKNILTISKKII